MYESFSSSTILWPFLVILPVGDVCDLEGHHPRVYRLSPYGDPLFALIGYRIPAVRAVLGAVPCQFSLKLALREPTADLDSSQRVLPVASILAAIAARRAKLVSTRTGAMCCKDLVWRAARTLNLLSMASGGGGVSWSNGARQMLQRRAHLGPGSTGLGLWGPGQSTPLLQDMLTPRQFLQASCLGETVRLRLLVHRLAPLLTAPFDHFLPEKRRLKRLGNDVGMPPFPGVGRQGLLVAS